MSLIEDNIKLVYFIINKYYPTWVNDEDIIQTGMLGLCKAAENWDESVSTFSTYASKCICNEIRAEFKRRKRHSGVYSLDYEMTNSEGESTSFGDIQVGDEDVTDIDCLSFDCFVDQLSEADQQIIQWRQDGMDTPSIAERLGVGCDTVYKTIRKIMRMWREYNEDTY